MADIYRLLNQIKHYEWGSQDMLPDFMGFKNDEKKPCAEMWMGTHNSAPSQAELDGRVVDLAKVSGELPFLFKVIAVGKPLSIQAHPNKQQAEAGFKKEEESGLAVKAPSRNYKDSNHKPEIICAITPFTMMAGFREPESACKSFKALLSTAPPLKEILTPLIQALSCGSFVNFFSSLFNLSRIEREYLCGFICGNDALLGGGGISEEQWKLMREFAAAYPLDPAILSPLYLNILTIKPGQAIFIPAGVLHAYLGGLGLELMSSSDNVLRGGLTPKHIDIGELINVLHFVPFIPHVINPASSSLWFSYHTPCRDFLLSNLNGKGENIFPGSGPAICIVIEGELKTCGKTFKKSDSFFIPQEAAQQPLLLEGYYSLFVAGRNVNPRLTNLKVKK